jgi:hypothetical protein
MKIRTEINKKWNNWGNKKRNPELICIELNGCVKKTKLKHAYTHTYMHSYLRWSNWEKSVKKRILVYHVTKEVEMFLNQLY